MVFIATLSVTSKTSTSITVTISGLTHDPSLYGGFRFRINGGSWNETYSTSYTFIGLSPGTTYSFDSETYWDDPYDPNDVGQWYSSGSCTGTTDTESFPAPYIYEDSKSYNWIQIIRGCSDSTVTLTTYINGIPISSSGYTYIANGDYVLISGLQPNTTYSFYVKGEKNGEVKYSDTIYITTLNSPRPSNWEWYNPKVSGQPINVTATEWNDFCTRINEFRQYKSIFAYPFTTVQTGTPISASIFNEAINAISSMVSTMSTVSSGGYIYASYFNRLRDDLNSIN